MQKNENKVITFSKFFYICISAYLNCSGIILQYSKGSKIAYNSSAYFPIMVINIVHHQCIIDILLSVKLFSYIFCFVEHLIRDLTERWGSTSICIAYAVK